MASQFATWPFRWFGCWREFGPAFGRCPGIDEFVDEGWHHARVDELVRYLARAPMVSVTSRLALPWARGEGDDRASVAWRTDGVWLWLDDLDYYVADQSVRPPDAFVARIEARDFAPPKRLRIDRSVLEWPPEG